MAKLPPQLNGFKIVQLSDIHRSWFVDAWHVSNVVEHVSRLEPDVVVLTGDFVAGSAKFAESCANLLGKVRAKYGVVAVLGNHDYWTDFRKVMAELNRIGVRVLRNEHMFVERNGGRIWFVGLDDLWEGVPNLRRASQGVPEEGVRIVLMHNPDFFEALPEEAGELVLAGHTHGGQFRLPLCRPWIVPSALGNKYVAGWFQKGRMRMYVNRGIGVTILPLRFLVRPEISLFTLSSSQPA